MGSTQSATRRAKRSPAADRTPRVVVVGGPTKGNVLLPRRLCELGYEASLVAPPEAADLLVPGDVALVRIDVLPTLDGVEPGLEDMELLVERGVRVVNPPAVLLAAHDKLVTSGLLQAAGVRQPCFAHVTDLARLSSIRLPCVLKPRFGSWGVDVFRCRTQTELEQAVDAIATRSWFRRQGVLVQELLPTPGIDLRVLVAGGRLVGAARRTAAPGEWRTNVTLGGSLERIDALPDGAAAQSLAAAAALACDVVGIDLLPVDGDHSVIELNGAPEFDERYGLQGANVFAELAAALDLPRCDGDPGRARSPSAVSCPAAAGA